MEKPGRSAHSNGDSMASQPAQGEVMAPNRPRLSSHSSEQITAARVLKVMAGGFALVICLLVAAAFVGIQNIQSIQQNLARLEEERAVTARLTEEIQGEQA